MTRSRETYTKDPKPYILQQLPQNSYTHIPTLTQPGEVLRQKSVISIVCMHASSITVVKLDRYRPKSQHDCLTIQFKQEILEILGKLSLAVIASNCRVRNSSTTDIKHSLEGILPSRRRPCRQAWSVTQGCAYQDTSLIRTSCLGLGQFTRGVGTSKDILYAACNSVWIVTQQSNESLETTSLC